MKKMLFFVWAAFLSFSLFAQTKTYTYPELSSGAVSITKRPKAGGVKMSADTTFTLYSECTVEMVMYFVDGDGRYNNLFNPNPTGIFLNKKHFQFYCDPEKAFRQSASNFLDIFEFTFLGRHYLCMFNYREDCVGEGCRYRCYNLFDITDPTYPTQTSFSSIYEGSDSFGDFNSDGILDFMRAAPKVPDDLKDKNKEQNYYIMTTYTFENGNTQLLKNSASETFYIWGVGETDGSIFSVYQYDWFFPLKDKEGKEMDPITYFPPYIAFDPREPVLYNSRGVLIEKQRWSLTIGDFTDLEGAQKFCEEMESRKFENVFIMADQYAGKITFQVLYGNFQDKNKAVALKNALKTRFGINAKLRDFKARY